MQRRVHACSPRFPLLTLGATLLGLLLCACRTVTNIPPADLSQPGWKTLQGQAVWKSHADAPEIAGELLVASHPQHGLFLQFMKPAFPIVVAQSGPVSWKVSFSGQREFSGAGKPPARISWFQLGAALEDRKLSRDWYFRKSDGQTFRLENARTGEFIEGYLTL
jgi:hypothetical protein